MPSERPHQPSRIISFTLLVVIGNYETYRVSVDAQTYEDAAREVIHVQMEKGCHVRSIREDS